MSPIMAEYGRNIPNITFSGNNTITLLRGDERRSVQNCGWGMSFEIILNRNDPNDWGILHLSSFAASWPR